MSLPVILSLGKAYMDERNKYYANQQNQKDRSRKIAGLRKLADVTPAEREYEKRRRDIIEKGDPLINKAGGEAIQTTRQQGQFNRIRSQGQAIQQGLENSIVAQELRRKVDKDVLRSVAEQARKMALANAQAKRRAEGELEQFEMMKDDRARKIDAQITGLPKIPEYDRYGALARIGMSAGDAYMNMQQSGSPEDEWIDYDG